MDYQTLIEDAHREGMTALNECCPTPMVVVGHSHTGESNAWYVDEGMCGFAWIEFAGNTDFGRWAKKMKVATKAYPKGLMIWVSEGNQSYDRKRAYAEAYARVLNEAGIKAYANSRLD